MFKEVADEIRSNPSVSQSVVAACRAIVTKLREPGCDVVAVAAALDAECFDLGIAVAEQTPGAQT